MTSVKVAVRVRPQAQRELEAGEAQVVHVDQERGVIAVTNLKVPEFAEGDSRERTRHFSFDTCYDIFTPQDALFNEVGHRVLDALASGYNACVLAYGQSGSGKTFTMMGRQGQPGLTPRICQALFSRLNHAAAQASPDQNVPVDIRVAVCFLEIHKERVRDLLTAHAPPLRVREHPQTGPYVQDLSVHEVGDAETLMSLLAEGNARRCTARSGEHARSSRSHAVFTISCPQGRAHLVDLAGSERAEFSSRERREEGANINKSLVTLGNVISALAERPRCCHFTPPRRCSHAHVYVPYRDSVLTWLLRDSLGGNAKTFMIATVSPSSGCYSETVNTLRYAQRAKRIVNQPVVNTGMPEEAAARTIRELRAEVNRLRAVLAALQGNGTLKHGGLSDGRGDSLTRRWIARWYAHQLKESNATQSVRSASTSTSSHHTQMGQRASSHSPAVSPGTRSSSQSLAEEASEATERTNSTILLPVMFVDHANTGRTELKRTLSSCELVYRKPARALHRVQRRYASQDSIPHNSANTDHTLSPGGSENSLASSSSSLESQRSLDSRLHRSVTGTSNTYKKKVFKSAIPIRIPTSRSSSDSSERRLSTTSIASSSSVPDLSRTNNTVKKKKADIVAAVTQRLYPKKKVKSAASHTEESSEPCSRASLRDLSKRLLNAARNKTEAETQTEKDNETKEASVGTEKITPPESIHAFITSEVFLPTMCLCQFDTVNESVSVQPDLLGTCRDSPCSVSESNATISPSISVELPPCFKHCDEECFSDDSLDSKRDIETDSLDGEKPCLWKVVNLSSGQDFLGTEPTNKNSDGTNKKSADKLNQNNNNEQAKNLHTKIENNNDSVVIEGELPVEENWEISVLIGDESDLENSSVNLKISNEKLTDDENTLFNGLPMSSEESEQSRPQSSDDNNSCPSPISSDAASTGSDSSSGDDFVYYLQAPDDKGPSARCLYTIAENSEHSDHSESMEPSLSPPLHVPLSSQKLDKKESILNLPQEKSESNNNTNQTNFAVENILTSTNNPVTTISLITQNCVSFPMNISTSVPIKNLELLQESSAILIPETQSTPPNSSMMRASTPSRAHTTLTSSLLGSPPLSSTHENTKQNISMTVTDKNVIPFLYDSQIQNIVIPSAPVASGIGIKNSLQANNESLNLIINSHDKTIQNLSLNLNSNKNLSETCLREGGQLNSSYTNTNGTKNHSQSVPYSLCENLANATSLNPQNKISDSRISAVKKSLSNSYELPNLVTSTENIPKNLTINMHNSHESLPLTSHLLNIQNANSDIPLTAIKNPIRNDSAIEDFSPNRNDNAFKNHLLNSASNSSTDNVAQRLEPQNSYLNARNNVLKNPLCNIYEPLSSPKLVSRSPSPRLSFENASQSPATYFNNNISSQSPNLFQVENASPNFSFNYTQKQNSYETENSNPKYYQSNLKSRSPSPNLINLNTPPPELFNDSKNLQRDFTRNYSPQKHDNLNNFYSFPDNTRCSPQPQLEGVIPMSRGSEISYPSIKYPPINYWPPEQTPSYILPSDATFTQPNPAPLLPALPKPQQGKQTAVTTLSQAFARTATSKQEPSSTARPYAYQQASTSRDVTQRESRRAEPVPRRYPCERTSVSPEQTIQWADARQRQFLNVSVVAPTRALPASVGLQDTSTASEDSITFVYVGPARRHAPPVLLELVRRSVGGRGLQRSVSLDSATRALARLSQRRRSEVVRACSMDTLVPEETHAFLEPARRERAPYVPEIPRRSPPRRSFSPATPSDSEVRSTDDDFDDVPPPELPRATGIDTEKAKRWADMKHIILGQQPRMRASPSPPLPPRPRTVGKKAVSWSDVSGCGLLSSSSTHSLPSPTSLSGSPKPIIKKSTLAPVPQSPLPSPKSRSPQTQSPIPGERVARRDRLHLDLQTPQWPQQDPNRLSPDFRRHQASRLSPEPPYYGSRPEPIWTRERSMSAPSSPYREHPWSSRMQEEHSPSPADWQRERRGSSASAPSTPLSGSPGDLNFRRYARSRSPPRCGSPRCRSLGDVSELGRDAESLRAFLAQATTLLHSLSDLSRFLEQQPIPQQRSSERAVQTEDDDPHVCAPPRASRIYETASHPIRTCEPSRPRCSHRSDPIPIQQPAHCCSHVHSCCSHAHHSCSSPSTRSSRPCYQPSVLERQLEASCARLESSLQQPPEWETLFEDELQGRGATSRPLGSPTPRYTPMPPLPSRSVRPHFSPRAYMRHLLGVRRRIIEAARQEQLNKNPDDI